MVAIEVEGVIGTVVVAQRQVSPQELIDEAEEIIEQFAEMEKQMLREEISPNTSSPSRCFVKILEILKSAEPSAEKIKAAVDSLAKDISEKSKSNSEEHARAVLAAIEAFPNLLIVIALGNDGSCIDGGALETEYLKVPEILSHVVLVSGSRGPVRDGDSNFTEKFAEHAISRPMECRVWDPAGFGSKIRLKSGTSFSAPVATADAYKIAAALQSTGTAFDFNFIKKQLLEIKE